MFKLLVPLRLVPDNYLVTKIMGEKEYTIQEEIVIYGPNNKTKVEIDKDCKAVITAEGQINIWPQDKIVSVPFETIEDLREFVEELYIEGINK